MLFALLTAMSSPVAPQPTAVIVRAVGDKSEVDLQAVFEFVPSLDAQILARDLQKTVLDCAGELSCVVDACPADFTRAVVAIIETREDHIGVAVDVIDTQGGRRLARHFGEIDPNTRTPRRAIADELLAALDAAGHPAHGALLLELVPDDATVTVADATLDRPRALLLPGVHTLDVNADDHESANLEVFVVAGTETSRRIELEPSGPSYWLWVGIGAAAVAVAAVTVAVVASPQDAMTVYDLCQRPAEGMPCGAAR